jgi:hypothetical protein
MKRHATIGAVVIGLTLSSCGGDDDNKATTSPAPPDTVETPSESAPPAAEPGALPPEFQECMAEQGFAVSSLDDIHSAPQQMLQRCFASLHQGGGTP